MFGLKVGGKEMFANDRKRKKTDIVAIIIAIVSYQQVLLYACKLFQNFLNTLWILYLQVNAFDFHKC